MNVKQIVVEIHEKRAHPSEMGHYDAKVEYTVEISEAESPDETVKFLQSQARQQVAIECDKWIAEIERKQLAHNAKQHLDWIIDRAEGGYVEKNDDDQFELYLIPLSEGERAEYTAKLMAAKDKYLAAMRKRLNADIESVESGKPISNHNLKIFYLLLDNLPADEREDFRNSMMLALAPKEEATRTEAAGDIAF